jgi:hypothetical protein
MNKQIVVMSEKPSPFKMGTGFDRMSNKPKNGFWTSSETTRGCSEWTSWCSSEMPEAIEGRGRYAMAVRPDARVLIIDSLADLKAMHSRFGIKNMPFMTVFDWNAVAHYYDGVHLTSRGQDETRHSHPLDLYGWDVESTVWFKWCFSHVEELKTWDEEPGFDWDEEALTSQA